MTGWTGGHYSIYRAALAMAIAAILVSRGLPGVLLILGLLLCVALALGWRDRIAALLLLLLVAAPVAFLDGTALADPAGELVLGSLLLVLHAAMPPRPFGSWDARGRDDPAGGWEMPAWLFHSAWTLLAILYLGAGLERVSALALEPGWTGAGWMAGIGLLFDGVFLVAVFRVSWRPAAWLAMSLWQIAWLSAFGPTLAPSSLWLLHLLAVDPAWLPGRTRVAPEAAQARSARLFYDGECGLCHRSVRFILAEERGMPEPLRLRFAPLQGELFERWLDTRPDLRAGELPDSILLELEDGRVLTRSGAALEIAERLGGFWRVLATVVRPLPEAWLDGLYDGLARVRKRLFAEPKASCPILPPDLRARFDL